MLLLSSIPRKMEFMSKVLVVIPTLWRPTLLSTMFGLLSQTVKPYEVIINAAKGGSSVSRNRGALKCEGDVEYILFVDDDAVPKPNWVERTASLLHEYDVVINNVETYGFGLCPLGGNTIGCGYRAEVFRKLGGFDEENTPHWAGDTELAWRAIQKGYSYNFDEEKTIVHIGLARSLESNTKEWIRRGTQYIKKTYPDLWLEYMAQMAGLGSSKALRYFHFLYGVG